jgi:Predicted permeases
MRILHRYLAHEVLGGTLLVLSGLLMLFAFFDLINELGDLGKGNYSLARILGFVLLSLPGHVYELLPIAALIGTLFALSQLVAHSEFTVMRASGMSVSQVVQSLVKGGTVVVVLTLLFGELIAPASEKAAQQVKLKATSTLVAQKFRSGLWVKDASNFVNVREMLPDSTLRGISIYEFDRNAQLRTISHAEKGVFQAENRWKLHMVSQTLFQGNTARTIRLPEAEWRSEINPDLLGVLLVVPEQMSAWNLFFYIQHLRENQQSTTRYEIAMWGKLFYPFASWVMMLLALPFALVHARAGGVSAKIFAGIMLGLGFHLLNRIFAHLGLLEAWPPLFSAVFPSLAFLGVAVTLMWWQERR